MYNSPGAIEGGFASTKYSWTSLMGQKDDTVLYEVYDGKDGSGPVAQKQLTTIREVTLGRVRLVSVTNLQSFYLK